MPTIRPLLPFEGALIGQHFMRLTDEERYSRFAGPASAALVERYVERLEWTRAVRLGWFEAGTLRALAELVLTRDGAGELALTVEGPYQHRGIASELTNRILLIARNRGIRRIVAHCLAENRCMRGLVRKFAGEVVLDGASAEARLSTGTPSPLSFWHEGVQTAGGLVGCIAQQLIGDRAGG
jgi:GNAT superfamily N-acetyltransferase